MIQQGVNLKNPFEKTAKEQNTSNSLKKAHDPKVHSITSDRNLLDDSYANKVNHRQVIDFYNKGAKHRRHHRNEVETADRTDAVILPKIMSPIQRNILNDANNKQKINLRGYSRRRMVIQRNILSPD